jgi:hypothetical protein
VLKTATGGFKLGVLAVEVFLILIMKIIPHFPKKNNKKMTIWYI